MSHFVHGMITMGFLVVALFFARFWRRTADTLFVAFAVAFVLLAINQFLLSRTGDSGAHESWAFLPSLGAFGLLIAAILIKNMSRKGL